MSKDQSAEAKTIALVLTDEDFELFPVRNGVLCLSAPDWWETPPTFSGEMGDFEHWNGEKP